MPALDDVLARAGATRRYALAGNVAFVAWPHAAGRSCPTALNALATDGPGPDRAAGRRFIGADPATTSSGDVCGRARPGRPIPGRLMQHQIPVDSLPPGGRAMARAVETCVHCGFCLPSCPTYRVLGEEMDSPRGRIVLMKQALEGELAAQRRAAYMDRCLGCLGCETSCPSGVHYRDLLMPFRAKAEAESAARSRATGAARALLALLESPALFRLAVRAAISRDTSGRLVPAALRADAALLPASLEPARPAAAIGAGDRRPRRARVALLRGLRPAGAGAGHQSRHRCGCWPRMAIEVVVPPDQGCCGALAAHAGHAGHARERARAAAARRSRRTSMPS